LKSIKGLKERSQKEQNEKANQTQKKKKKNTDEVAFGMLYGAQNIVFFV